jgi:hypothetical protein
MVLIWYHKYLYFLYRFSQTYNLLTPWKVRIAFFLGLMDYKLAKECNVLQIQSIWLEVGSKNPNSFVCQIN